MRKEVFKSRRKLSNHVLHERIYSHTNLVTIYDFLQNNTNKKLQSDLGRGRDATNSPELKMGCPTFVPKNTHSHGSTTNLPASSMDLSDLPSQTASIYDQPFCHNAPDRQTDRHTDRETSKWLEEMFNDYRPLSLYTECHGRIIMGIKICRYTSNTI